MSEQGRAARSCIGLARAIAFSQEQSWTLSPLLLAGRFSSRRTIRGPKPQNRIEFLRNQGREASVSAAWALQP
jgi:hypothetical protein